MILEELQIDTGSRFTSYQLTKEQTDQALRSLSPLFHAYIANKIAAYASALVELEPEYSADPKQQMLAILSQERLRNHVQAYEELLAELIDASSQQPSQPESE